jgi:hypothetical protein
MDKNPLEPRLEHQLTQHAQDKHLEELHSCGQFDKLLEAAKLLNQLYYTERIKTDWAIREACKNLSSMYGYDPDSC